jgi:hypothetical protein
MQEAANGNIILMESLEAVAGALGVCLEFPAEQLARTRRPYLTLSPNLIAESVNF